MILEEVFVFIKKFFKPIFGGYLILKTFILDTNVLLQSPASLKAFGNNEIVIPLSVLDELDNIKIRIDELGRNARAVIRILDELRQTGSLNRGVKYEKSIIRVELNHKDHVPEGLVATKVDNRLISTALGLQKEGKEIIVVSKDINLRVKCDAVGITSSDYTKDKLAEQPDSIYTGIKILEVPSTIIDELYSKKSVIIEGLEGLPNQFFVLKANTSQSAIARFDGSKLTLCKDYKNLWGISARNAEQKMAMELLLDPEIKLVTLVGRAGSGKTLLSCAAALQMVIKEPKIYQRILISRPIQPMGRDIGFLPGDIEEKLNPWMQPIYDNLEFLLGGDYQMLNMYKDEGLIQVEPLTYIRGRSIPKSLIILDEAQNLTAQEIKTIVTRLGEDSKIIITGDIEQIDNPYVDFADNGLTHVIERFKFHQISGHITLVKGERSKLATLASKIL